jgi:hypothetical protein
VYTLGRKVAIGFRRFRNLYIQIPDASRLPGVGTTQKCTSTQMNLRTTQVYNHTPHNFSPYSHVTLLVTSALSEWFNSDTMSQVTRGAELNRLVQYFNQVHNNT